MRSLWKGAAVLLCAAVCAFFAYALLRRPVFEGGGSYELYLGASSGARIVQSDFPARDKLLYANVRGESARYAGDRYLELKEKFRAELLFTERAAGVTNYYLTSPLLGEGIALEGGVVNLHIAVSGDTTVAGTPLIFGGF